MTVTVRPVCTCPHSARSHRRGHGRCEVPSCGCLYGPLPVPRTTRPKATGAPSQRSKLEALLEHRIELAGLPVPLKQFYWARSEKRMYRSDFAYVGSYGDDPAVHRILIEVQGGIWAADPGRHNRGSGYERDCERDNLAAILGYKLLRFTERMIRDGTAVNTISRALIPAGLGVSI